VVNRLRRAPAEVLRVEALRLLLEETHARYPGVWRELLAAVEAAGGEAEAIGEAVWAWAQRYHLADERGLVVLAAWRLLAGQVPAMRRGQAAKVALVERLAGYAPAPRPIPIPTIWLAGWREGMTAAELRRLALEAAQRAVDEAIERWRAAADEAGLAAEPEGRSERAHAEWLARRQVGGESVAEIAAAAGAEPRAVHKAVAAMARRAGLRLRPARRGRPKK
jgi:hypothetical protein